MIWMKKNGYSLYSERSRRTAIYGLYSERIKQKNGYSLYSDAEEEEWIYIACIVREGEE